MDLEEDFADDEIVVECTDEVVVLEDEVCTEEVCGGGMIQALEWHR